MLSSIQARAELEHPHTNLIRAWTPVSSFKLTRVAPLFVSWMIKRDIYYGNQASTSKFNRIINHITDLLRASRLLYILSIFWSAQDTVLWHQIFLILPVKTFIYLYHRLPIFLISSRPFVLTNKHWVSPAYISSNMLIFYIYQIKLELCLGISFFMIASVVIPANKYCIQSWF